MVARSADLRRQQDDRSRMRLVFAHVFAACASRSVRGSVLMDPRLPPIPVALTGAPRTGIAALPAPRPPYRLTLHRDGPTRTIHPQRAAGTGPVTHAPLLH